MKQPYYRTVDTGVKVGIRDFRPPAARKYSVSREWLVLAASLLLATGVLMFGGTREWPFTESSGVSRDVDRAFGSTAVFDVVAREGFESPELIFEAGADDSMLTMKEGSSLPGDLEQSRAISASVFGDGLESGDTGRWRVSSKRTLPEGNGI